MKRTAIVTVDFNSENETHACIDSLKLLETPQMITQIIVVDNASKKPFTLTTKEKDQKVMLIRNEKNLGFSGGYNTGILAALKEKFDYIMIINNDTIADKQLLTELIKVAENNPLAGIIGPKIYFAKGHEFHRNRYQVGDLGKVLWYAGGGIDWKNVMSYHRGVDEVDHGQYDVTQETGFVTGCCMLFPREVLEKVGMLNDDYFLYFEDAEFNMRVLKAGYKIMFAPKAILWHVNAVSSGGSGSTLHDYFITRNRLYFGLSYAPFRAKIALFRESLKLLVYGRTWQKIGVRDFYFNRNGKGSFGI